MTTVTAFRHPPPPIIGECGVVFDRAFQAFEKGLDWLDAIGVLLERVDPQEPPEDAARFEAVTELLAREGHRCLPLVLVDGVFASSGVHPTRSRSARLWLRVVGLRPPRPARRLA